MQTIDETAAANLPAAFSELETIAARWALETENQRSEQRWRARPEDLQSAYDAIWPRIPEMLAYLDGRDAVALKDQADRRLLHLALAFAEIAPHVELYGASTQVPNSFANDRFRPDHGDDVAGQSDG